MEETKTPPLHRRRWFYPAAALVLAAVLWLCATRVAGPGGLYPRDAAALDLRAETMTCEEFDALQAKLPDCAIRWSVPIGDKRLDSESTTVHVGAFTEEDIPNFAYFTRLRRVDGANSESYEALLALKEARPDIDVKWGVDIGGVAYGQGCGSLRLDGAKLAHGELLEQLRWLPELKTVTVSGTMDPAEQAALMEAYPHITFDWEVALCGGTFRSTDTEISLAGQSLTEADLREIQENVFRFNALEVIDLTDCGFDNERLRTLREETGAEIRWSFAVCGRGVSSLDTEIDLSGVRIDDVTAVEDMLPYFSRLEKVVMCDCGPSNEEMAALNDRHEDVRFVWMVHFAYYSVRTDAVEFIASKQRPYTIMHDYDTAALWYLTDLVGLDLGHMEFSDISFLYAMPHLKYLILADCDVRDITPIGSLKELTYLELFQCPIRDITPLGECTALEDLNICYIRAPAENALPVLTEMIWLERLWYCGSRLSDEELVLLQETIPGCEMSLGRHDESTGNGWREHEHYYQMRDFFGMYYMKGGTNGVDDNGNQIYY